MADGMFDRNVGFIIQARMDSERLPGKVLMSMPCFSTTPLIEHILNTLEPLGGKVIVAISEATSSDAIADFCYRKKVHFVRGDERNVLSRFVTIQEKFGFQYIFRFTADNPLIDTEKMVIFFQKFLETNVDYAYSKGLPLGMNFECFRGEALLRSVEYAQSKEDREHVTYAIKRSELFKKTSVVLDNLEGLRMTVDTAIDYVLMSMIYEFKNKVKLDGITLVKLFSDNYPWLIEINKHINQKS